MSPLSPDRPSRLALPTTAIGVVLALHVLGWGALLLAIVPQISGDAAAAGLLAVGLTAYALGLRHAFDADHIAAIDNTTRRLIERGRPARNVGTWFALGHSTVVFVLCALLTWGAASLAGALADDSSALHQVTGIWGPFVSSSFLLLLAAMSIGALISRRRDTHSGGPIWRSLSRVESAVDRPSRMYGVGLLFGLGFDTATEIGLLALAGTAAVSSLPWWVVLALPVVFAAGMTTLDTAQAYVAHRAYSHAAGDGRGVTGYATGMMLLSALVATVVAVVQLSGVAADELGWGGPIAWLASMPIEDLGIGLTILLVIIWLSMLLLLRGRRSRLLPEP